MCITLSTAAAAAADDRLTENNDDDGLDEFNSLMREY